MPTLVRDFEADPARHRTLIRNLLQQDPVSFYSRSLEIWKNSPDCRGVQCLLSLMGENGMLAKALCDPALSRQQAMALARAAIRLDPITDAALTRGLAESQLGQDEDASRLMEILCEVGDTARMKISLLRLLRHPNPYLRSKAVKVIGRDSKGVQWVRLQEPDPRIRANAIEALWGLDTPDARQVLQHACVDGNNRVAANAQLGLYYLGDPSASENMETMARHESGLFRAAAAWAMGETRDTRFRDTARRLLSDSDPAVRRLAFSALGRIKNARCGDKVSAH